MLERKRKKGGSWLQNRSCHAKKESNPSFRDDKRNRIRRVAAQFTSCCTVWSNDSITGYILVIDRADPWTFVFVRLVITHKWLTAGDFRLRSAHTVLYLERALKIFLTEMIRQLRKEGGKQECWANVTSLQDEGWKAYCAEKFTIRKSKGSNWRVKAVAVD